MKKVPRIDFVLLFAVLLTAFLNIFNIWENTYSNSYYTAAVTSMLQSFHNFFYASFDPGGFVTVDKPPVAFWIQSLFAAVFGVHGWSVILPQALAGIGSVLLIYYLVKPSYGKTAARLASLVMSCTPIAAAVSRTNNIDSMLVFALLLATWMLFKGVREQKAGWIIGAFALIGVGFNMKMLQAYMVVPAFIVYCLLAYRSTWKKKLAILAAAVIVMLAVSFSWAAAVDLIPEQNRPYIGSSQTNSVLELAFGYNGIARLTGNNHNNGGGFPDRTGDDRNFNSPPPGGFGGTNQGPGMMPSGYNAAPPGIHKSNAVQSNYRPSDNSSQGPGELQVSDNGIPQGPPADDGRQFGPGSDGQRPGFGLNNGAPRSSGMFGTGTPGPFRLFQAELSEQISWLLPFALLGCIPLLAGIKLKKPLSDKQTNTLFWLAWLIPGMAFFSAAGFFHHYYLIMLAPPIAALVGPGWTAMLDNSQTGNSRIGWLLPAGILITTTFQIYIMYPYLQALGWWWAALLGSLEIILCLIIVTKHNRKKWSSIAAGAAILVLLAAPLYWSATPLLYGDNGGMPQAGPKTTGSRAIQGLPGGFSSSINTKLLGYVTSHNTGETFLFATSSSQGASPYIIETGRAVMAMGGFSGSDPILTVDKVKRLVADKKVKFFLISSGNGGGFGGNSSSAVMEWIRDNGTEIPRKEWSDSTLPNAMGRDNADTLYEIDLEE